MEKKYWTKGVLFTNNWSDYWRRIICFCLERIFSRNSVWIGSWKSNI